MTKTEAKKLIKEHYNGMFEALNERIVDWNLWKEGGEYMYNIITISNNHVPYRYSGYFSGNKVINLSEATCLLTITR